MAEQPLREHLHGQLMLALYRCGRQAEALEAYRTARRTLVEEVGVEPGAELRALQDAILAQDPALDAPPGPEELPAALEGGSPILAGRDRELAELVGLLADACRGPRRRRARLGPRGIGKTRLAAELAREALRRRMTVVYTGAVTPPADALAAIRRAEESAAAGAARRRRRGRRAPRGARPRRCGRRRQRGAGCCSSSFTRSRAAAGLRGSGGALARARPARGRGHSGDRAPLPAGRGEPLPIRGARRGERWPSACRASRGRRVGADARLAGGGASAGRAAAERGELRAAEAELSERPARSPHGRRARPALPRRGGRGAAAGGLPLPRARHLRRGSRGVLLRSRAARGRAGRPPGGLTPSRRRRTLGEREVLGGPGRPPAGARERGAPRLRTAGLRR